MIDMSQKNDSLIMPPGASLLEQKKVLASSLNGDVAKPFDLIIQPHSGWIGINWNEMVSHRELLFYFIWRDISVRYKQTVLGPAWAILQPLILMLIFTVIFGRVVKLPSEGFDYPVFVFAGLIPWTLFSQGFAQAGLSLMTNVDLVNKVYFPRMIIPGAAIALHLVD